MTAVSTAPLQILPLIPRRWGDIFIFSESPRVSNSQHTVVKGLLATSILNFGDVRILETMAARVALQEVCKWDPGFRSDERVLA